MIYNYLVSDDNQKIIETGSVNDEAIVSATHNAIKLIFDKNDGYNIENISQYYNEGYSFITFRKGDDRLFAVITKKK